jgi:hypothetical protein
MAPKPAAPAAAPSKPTAPARKKGPLKGVMVKKKAKPAATPAKEDDTPKNDEQPDPKRRRISEA